jgi:PAS domain S-box-containing protein
MVDDARSTILFVDDDEENRLALSWIFRTAGFAVKEAATGSDALRLVAERPDLVILDVNLPDMNGFEVCKRIKAHPATAAIPILHLSACFISSQDKVNGLDSGADGYLIKPVEPQELVAQARALLRVRQAEEQARTSARQWQATFDAIRDGVCLLDVTGTIVRCNAAVSQILGLPTTAIIGRHPDDLLPSANLLPRAGEGGVRGAAEETSLFNRLLRTRRRETAAIQGGDRWLHVTADPIHDEAGTFTGAVFILADVTEQKLLEEQLRQSQKMEAIGRLAGGVAHDFNNLLTAITGSVSLLQADLPAHDPLHDVLQTIDKAAWRAAELTRQLLGFSRQTKLWLEPVNLNHCIDEMVSILRRTIDPRITVRVSAATNLRTVQADPAQINQVLMNLCLNARDAMPEGGRLLLETENLVLTEDYSQRRLDVRPGEYVRLRVTDTGHGIHPDIQPYIFDPFFTTKEFGKGTGLGLAMVFGIVKQHGGWIECHSAVNEGTRIEVYLPSSAEWETTGSVPSLPAGPRRGSETILLADDDPLLRDLGRTILQRHGYRVLLAEDGRRAVDIFRREQHRINLVILDLTMPELSGSDALRELRQIQPDVPALFSSGYAMEQAPEMVTGEVLGFIAKPYRESDLVAAVREALDRKRRG